MKATPTHCPDAACQSRRLRRHGTFARRRDGARIRRFRCLACQKTFSTATHAELFRQKRTDLNRPIYALFNSGVSQRRLARLLATSRRTVARKLAFLAGRCRRQTARELASLAKAPFVQLDEMESFEHTKMKPLSITVAVVHPTRRILAAAVASMPAKGLLAARSRRKYGPRPDHREAALAQVLGLVRQIAEPGALIRTDQCPRYPGAIARHLPEARHVTVKGRRGCVVGQGELKRGGFDPLFSLNHTCAMFRANVNRLFRRTWCTTKKLQSLQDHLDLYVHYHNNELLAR